MHTSNGDGSILKTSIWLFSQCFLLQAQIQSHQYNIAYEHVPLLWKSNSDPSSYHPTWKSLHTAVFCNMRKAQSKERQCRVRERMVYKPGKYLIHSWDFLSDYFSSKIIFPFSKESNLWTRNYLKIFQDLSDRQGTGK